MLTSNLQDPLGRFLICKVHAPYIATSRLRMGGSSVQAIANDVLLLLDNRILSLDADGPPNSGR